MKKLIQILIGIGLMASSITASATAPMSAKLLPSTQAVINSVVNHPDLMVITGKIVDAENYQPITDAKINFDRFGDELVSAAIDKEGNYALAISKKEVGEQVRIIFKIEGYQKYIAKAVKTSAAVVDLDLYLRADESNDASTARVKYALSDDPFNTLVIKF